MLFNMVVSIYTSRVVLDALGIDDYGIYNVVGSFVALFSFLSSSMSLSVSRFLGINIGIGDRQMVKKVFAASLNIHIVIAIIIAIVVEIVGTVYIFNFLHINEDRIYASYVVFQFSLIALIISVIRSPYAASITINEDINIYALLSVLESIAKLGIVYILTIFEYDRLELYGILICVVTVLISLIYVYFSHSHYYWCKVSFFWEKSLYYELIRYALINTFGNMINMFVTQGQNIILNFYFGPVVNAARGIAYQTDISIRGFVTNIFTAVNPQLIKSYGENNVGYMKSILQNGAVLSFSFLLFISIPVILYIDLLLDLWLVEVPEYTNSFIILLLINSLIYANAQPIMQAIHSTARIGQFNLFTGIVNCLNIILPILFLKKDSNPQIVFIIYIFVNILIILVTLQQMRRTLKFGIKDYILNVYWKEILILFFSFPLPVLYSISVDVRIANFVICLFLSFLSVTISTYCWGVSPQIKNSIKKNAKNSINKYFNSRT